MAVTLEQKRVRLGFAEGLFPMGTHMCQIFSDDDERNGALIAFLLAGMQDGERAACFSERLDTGALAAALAGQGLCLEGFKRDGSLTLAGANEVYFRDDRFDPDRMLGLLTAYYDESRLAGRAARVIGEMSPAIGRIEGGHRLMEYECRVSLLLREKPIATVCQYEAAAFDGAMIMDILKVHPMMVVRGEVLHNPFYVPPVEFQAL
jgi:hypothetical protein